MSLTIRLKHSTSKNKTPQASDLKPGELALNVHNDSLAGYALNNAGAVKQMFGGATETQKGQAEIATQGEVNAGTDNARIVTPKKLKQRLSDYTTNTVNPAVAVETAARVAAITAEQNTRAAAITAEQNARIAGDQQKVAKAGDTMTGPLTITDNLTVNSLNGGPLAGLRNLIINGNFRINQRQQSKNAANGAYGYDRWKGDAAGLKQTVESIPAGEYTLSWKGGGNGRIFGSTGSSPITATNASFGNKEVIVPKTATEVQLELGPVATPFEHRPIALELSLCQRYYFQSTCRVYLCKLYEGGANVPKFGGGIALPVTMRTTPSYNQAGSTLNNIAVNAGTFYWQFLARPTPNSIAFTGQQIGDAETFIDGLQLEAEF